MLQDFGAEERSSLRAGLPAAHPGEDTRAVSELGLTGCGALRGAWIIRDEENARDKLISGGQEGFSL